jgi:hypothetical protein
MKQMKMEKIEIRKFLEESLIFFWKKFEILKFKTRFWQIETYKL